VICKSFPASKKLQAAPVPRPPQPTSPAFNGFPSGAAAKISGTATSISLSFSDAGAEQLFRKTGVDTAPTTPNAELLRKSLRLKFDLLFMTHSNMVIQFPQM
jgi:hypothetical protein